MTNYKKDGYFTGWQFDEGTSGKSHRVYYGETLIDKPYKYRKNALKAIVRKTSDIMGTYIF